MTMQPRNTNTPADQVGVELSNNDGWGWSRVFANPGSRVLCACLLVLPAVVGVGLVMLATQDGAGISADSVFYLSVADEVAEGNGLRIPWGTPEPSPLGTRWAPLLPWLLGGIERLGVKPVVAVRYVNVLAFGATILLFGYALRRVTRSVWFAFFAAMCLATSRSLLAIHEMAWSEPLFLLFSFACLLLLGMALKRARAVVIVGAFACMVLALLTRFAGVALPMAACVAFVFGAGKLKHRFALPAAMFALLFVPMTSGGPLWIEWVINRFSVGENAKYGADYLLACFRENLVVAPKVIAYWLWPSRYCAELPALGLSIPIAVIAIISFGWLMSRVRRSHAFRSGEGDEASIARLQWILGVFVVVYPLFLVGGQLLFALDILAFDRRILSPMFVPGVTLLALTAHSILPRVLRWPQGRALVVAACVLFLCVRLPLAVERGFMLTSASGAGAEGYHDAKWRSSPTMAYLASLPPHVRIYSNAPDAVYVLAGRRACWLPTEWTFRNPEVDRDDGYTKPFDLEEALSRGAVIAYFDRISWRSSSPRLELLREHVSCRTLAQLEDGMILTGDVLNEAVAAGEQE